MKITKNTPIKDCVAVYPFLTKLFIEQHVDYCCNGHRTLLEASDVHGFDLIGMLKMIDEELASNQSNHNFDEIMKMNAKELETYIENTHHVFLKENLPVANELITRIVRAHSKNHPELLEVMHIYGLIQADLTTHLLREEVILFPLFNEEKNNEEIQKGIEELKREHEQVGEYIHQLQHVTKDYFVPKDGCYTYKQAYDLLKDIQEDIFMHIYLENSVLFEKVGQ